MFASWSCFASCIMEKHFYHGGQKWCFSGYFHHEIIFYCVELFECNSTLNFAGTFLYFLTLTHIKYQRSKISILQEAAIVLGAAVERCSGSKVLGLQLYFTGVFEDFGHIFTTCSKKFTKILKLGKIFRYVTSFYQHFFVSDPICYYKTNSGNQQN